MKVIELFCGGFGWSAGFLDQGWRSIGFDLEHHPWHGSVPYNASLVQSCKRSDSADTVSAIGLRRCKIHIGYEHARSVRKGGEMNEWYEEDDELCECPECIAAMDEEDFEDCDCPLCSDSDVEL